MKIEVLGMGCSNCNKLYQNVLEAVKQSGKDAEVAKIEDINFSRRWRPASGISVNISSLILMGYHPSADPSKTEIPIGKNLFGMVGWERWNVGFFGYPPRNQ